MNVLIITPMQQELDFFLEACTNYGYSSERSRLGQLSIYRLPKLGLTLARGGTGKAQFGIQTQYLLDSGRNWDLVVCAGAAGALDDILAIGDVIVAISTVEHDFNDKFSERLLPVFEGAESTIVELRMLQPKPDHFSVHFGPVASGDEDIVDLKRGRELQQKTGALAAAWEGAGGARACQFSKVPFLEIRGLTDAADNNAPADFESNLRVAMQNVASLVMTWLEQRS